MARNIDTSDPAGGWIFRLVQKSCRWICFGKWICIRGCIECQHNNWRTGRFFSFKHWHWELDDETRNFFDNLLTYKRTPNSPNESWILSICWILSSFESQIMTTNLSTYHRVAVTSPSPCPSPFLLGCFPWYFSRLATFHPKKKTRQLQSPSESNVFFVKKRCWPSLRCKRKGWLFETWQLKSS